MQAEKDRETFTSDRQTDTQTKSNRDVLTETEYGREGERQGDRERERWREAGRQTDRQTDTRRQRQNEREKERDRVTERNRGLTRKLDFTKIVV